MATFRSNPRRSPPTMVDPERDMPGIKRHALGESDSHGPRQADLFHTTVQRMVWGQVSTMRIMIPPMMRLRATVRGEKKCSSIHS